MNIAVCYINDINLEVISMIVRQGINNSGGYMKNNWEKISNQEQL